MWAFFIILNVEIYMATNVRICMTTNAADMTTNVAVYNATNVVIYMCGRLFQMCQTIDQLQSCRHVRKNLVLGNKVANRHGESSASADHA